MPSYLIQIAIDRDASINHSVGYCRIVDENGFPIHSSIITQMSVINKSQLFAITLVQALGMVANISLPRGSIHLSLNTQTKLLDLLSVHDRCPGNDFKMSILQIMAKLIKQGFSFQLNGPQHPQYSYDTTKQFVDDYLTILQATTPKQTHFYVV